MQRTCELHAFPPRTLAPPTPPPPPLRTQVVFRAINDYSRVTLIAQMEGMKFAGLAYSASAAELPCCSAAVVSRICDGGYLVAPRS